MRASSEPAGGASRVTAAEALSRVSPFALPELGPMGAAAGVGAPSRLADEAAPPTPHTPPMAWGGDGSATTGTLRTLSRRDLSNETARAAFELGRRRGLDQGLREGRAQGEAASAQALAEQQAQRAAEAAAQMQGLARQFQEGLAALEGRVASELMALAVDLARQVLRRELQQDERAVLPAAREALRGVAEGAARIELRAHPLDAALLRQHLEAPAGATLQLVDDPAITRGGCRVHADTGSVDATLETRWRSVMDRLGREPGATP
jgi:flagellar assembly protein FliH